MFNFQGQEIFIILVLALMVLGPERLPEAMRKFGNFISEIRRMSGGFQEEFKAAVDEPMRQMRESVDMIREQTDIRKWQSSDPAPTNSDPLPAPSDDASESSGSTGVPTASAASANPTSFVPTFDTLPNSEPPLIDDTEPFVASPSRATDLRESNTTPTSTPEPSPDSSGSQLLRDFEYSRKSITNNGENNGEHANTSRNGTANEINPSSTADTDA